jgi:hypothetical protein
MCIHPLPLWGSRRVLLKPGKRAASSSLDVWQNSAVDSSSRSCKQSKKMIHIWTLQKKGVTIFFTSLLSVWLVDEEADITTRKRKPNTHETSFLGSFYLLHKKYSRILASILQESIY